MQDTKLILILCREEREKNEREEYELKNPKISQLFADAKRALASVTEEEWANLPEVGDLTGRNKRARRERMQRAYAVPDSVIAAAQSAGKKDEDQKAHDQNNDQPIGQMDTSISVHDEADAKSTTNGSATNFGAIGSARGNLLASRLAQAAKDAASTKVGNDTSTVIDKNSMMTALGEKEHMEGMKNLYDIKRTRPLLESVTKANPKYAPGWISAARLEELAGNVVAARNKVLEGCQWCPKNEDIWLEAVRLHKEGNNHNAKVIAYDAIQHNSKSHRLWLAAADLEVDKMKQRTILRKAVDNMPNSVVLWKAAANLENREGAKATLQKAVEYVPQSVELWVALAQLENKENARKVINTARQKLPTSHEIWVAAARLEESVQKENNPRIQMVMNRAVDVLKDQSAQIKREDWLKEAYEAEKDGAEETCKAVVRAIRNWNVEEDGRRQTWLVEAEAAKSYGHYKTARAIYRMACEGNTSDMSLWDAAIELEEQHGTKEDVYEVLQLATNNMPKVDRFWLKLANDKWQDDPESARIVLASAFKRNPSEQLFLAAVDLEVAAKDYDTARETLRTGRQMAQTDRIWTHSIVLERNLGREDEAFDMLTEGLKIFPRSGKMWIMKGQIYEAKGMYPQAREAYNTGTRNAPKFAPLWIAASRIEMKIGVLVKARSVLERGRKENPKSDIIWAEAVRLELNANNKGAAVTIMAAAQKELPDSGLLWAERILKIEERTKRKPRALDAMRKVENNKHILGAVARLFWAERQLEKANSWFEKAIAADPDYGDSWAWYLKFLQQHGTEEKIQEVIDRCAEARPKHGEIWPQIKKDPKNFGKDAKEILKMVTKLLEQ